MDFAPSEEQQLLQATARAFLEEKAPVSLARSSMEEPRVFAAELWKEMAELGWLGLTLPEDCGGAGLGIVDQILVLEEMGRLLPPVPYLPAAVASACLVELASAEQRREWLPGMAQGSTVPTLAIAEERCSDDAGIGLRARSTADGFALEGRKLFVPDAQSADLFVVLARTEHAGGREIAAFALPSDTPGLRILPQPAMDPLRRLSELQLEVELPAGARLGAPGGSARVRRALDRALVLISAEMLGGLQKCLDDSVAYARQRVQFGKPIGVHQAIKHKCADMLCAVESLRSLIHYAAWAIQEDHPSAPLAAAMAKAWAGESYRSCAKENLQIHGGVGFTWEYDCHLYLKRALGDDAWLGDTKHQNERIASLMAF